jgi:hypothetical protein
VKKKNQKVINSSLSKSCSKSSIHHLRKIQKSVRLDLVPVLRAQKQPKKTFQKTVKMYLVPATNLENKKKF